MTIVDHTRPAILHRRKPWWKRNPLPYAWAAWEHFAYFWAPANGCIYCFVLRLFILGLLIGSHVTYCVVK